MPPPACLPRRCRGGCGPDSHLRGTARELRRNRCAVRDSIGARELLTVERERNLESGQWGWGAIALDRRCVCRFMSMFYIRYHTSV